MLKFNQAWEQVLGYSANELRAIEVLSLVHPDDRHAAKLAFAGDQREVLGQEIRCRHKDGRYRWLAWSAVGADKSRYLVASDVTATKEAAALRREKDAAEAASRAKSQFLSNVSHDLRTPLTAILTLLDVLILDPSSPVLPADRADHLQTIKRNGEHLLQLINSPLDLAKIEAGKFSVESVPCDPGRVVSEVAELMRVRSEAKSLLLVVEHSTPLPPLIRTDPVRLRQVLINLVANAIAHTESGSVRIRVGVRREPAGPPMIRFEVVDTGVGMSQEEIELLFQPFHQIPDSRRRTLEGSGLGLAISRGLAEALSGLISVSSESGTGSSFLLTLPIEDPAASPPAREIMDTAPRQASAIADLAPATAADRTAQTRPEVEASPPDPRPRRVLLAEDNTDNRHAMALRLQLANIEVITACNGQEALEQCTPGARPST